MFKSFPFTRSYDVRCQDGSVKRVYRNADHAFPLSVTGYDANFRANVSSELLGDGELGGGLRTKVEGLLYGLSEINEGLMMSFRAAYIAYQTDPCSNNEFFVNQISQINEEQRRLRALKMQIRGYVDLAKNRPNDVENLAQLYTDLVGNIGSAVMGNAGVPEAINLSKDAAHQLMEGE